MKNRLTIIVCTYNRPEVLRPCLESLQVLSVSNKEYFKVIIINNAPDLTSQAKWEAIMNDFDAFRYINEEKKGLSFARNKGLSMAITEWVCFIDDDARPSYDFIERARHLIDSRSFDAFGGHIESVWDFGRPRWLAKDFGSKPIISNTVDLLKDHFFWGSNMFFKRSAIESIEGFPIDIGMKGGRLGYSADNLVQISLRSKGYKIGYDPFLLVKHSVLPHKLKLFWHIKAAFVEARDGRRVFPDNYTLKGFIKTFKAIVKNPFKSLLSLVIDPDFYIENACLESIKPWAQLFGKVKAIS